MGVDLFEHVGAVGAREAAVAAANAHVGRKFFGLTGLRGFRVPKMGNHEVMIIEPR